MPVRLSRYTIFGVSPDHTARAEFVMDDAVRNQWWDNGPEHKYYDAGLAGEVLSEPTSVFQGLQRPGFELSYCYCGKPPTRWIDVQVEAPSPAGWVMAFYVRPVEENVFDIWDWNWLEEDRLMPGHPASWQTNYARRTWPTS